MIQQLRSLPREVLPASATVDFLHFVACDKPAIRTQVQESDAETKVAGWCKQYNFTFQIDSDGYLCVARNAETACLVLSVDRSLEPHEKHLGILLGYPTCCCEFVATAGEANIDLLAEEIATWSFTGRFHRINPAGYLDGKALICHLPCSPNCLASLHLAEKALNFIISNAEEPILKPWLVWL
jgi:hypothetical protein